MIGQQEYPLSDHSDGKRFYNRDGSDKGLADISRFMWESLWSEAEWPESVANPAVAAIPDRVTQGIRTTYINHATVLIQVSGLNILTDPIWSEESQPPSPSLGPNASDRLGVAIDDLPEIDLILVSHNHYDHLDTRTLEALRQHQNKEPVIVSGLGKCVTTATCRPTLTRLNWIGAKRFRWERQAFTLSSVSIAQPEAYMIK